MLSHIVLWHPWEMLFKNSLRPLESIISYQAPTETASPGPSVLSFPPISEEHMSLFQSTLLPPRVLSVPWTPVYSGTLLYLFPVSHLNLQELSIKTISRSLLSYFKKSILHPTSSTSLHKKAYWNVNLYSLSSLCHSVFTTTFRHLPPTKMSHRGYQGPPCN